MSLLLENELIHLGYPINTLHTITSYIYPNRYIFYFRGYERDQLYLYLKYPISLEEYFESIPEFKLEVYFEVQFENSTFDMYYRIIDVEDIEDNTFHYIKEITLTSDMYSKIFEWRKDVYNFNINLMMNNQPID